MGCASAVQTPMSGVRSRSFTAYQAPLSAVEEAALRYCEQQIANGEPVTQVGVMVAIGSQNTTGGTSAGVLNRLEQKGYIERRVYQRGVQVCIGGRCSASPPCTAPHWRNREESVPAPAIQSVRLRSQSIAMQMEADARERGVSFAEHLIDLAYIGHHEFRAERGGE